MSEALRLLRTGNPAIVLGSLGYWAFDNLVLWACFRGFGVHVALTVVLMGYLIGQLGGLLPIPGGLGGVEGGLVGTLVVYGVSLRDAVAAVLAYRVIQFWIPLRALAARPSSACSEASTAPSAQTCALLRFPPEQQHRVQRDEGGEDRGEQRRPSSRERHRGDGEDAGLQRDAPSARQPARRARRGIATPHGGRHQRRRDREHDVAGGRSTRLRAPIGEGGEHAQLEHDLQRQRGVSRDGHGVDSLSR